MTRATQLPPPSRLLWAAELPRAAWTIAETAFARKLLAEAPRGDGRPVMALPGVAMGDISVARLAAYLRRLGYRAQTWQLGINRARRTIGDDGERLIARIEALHLASGAPVTLVGVSLGGIMARIAAHRRPDLVREVVTIHSPYAGDGRATNVQRAFEWASGEPIDSPHLADLLAEARRPLPVPATALWSRSDGLVNGAACHVPGEPGLRAIELRGGHLLVGQRARVLRTVADTLAGVSAR